MAGHVFISHGSENSEEANALCAFIEARGVKCWIAPRDVRPGIDYSEDLQAAIENAAAFVVLVTDHANKSPYVRAETEMAFSCHKPIFPIRQADIKPAAGLALFLKIRHWTDAYGKQREAAMDRLALELQTVVGVGPPAAAPAAPPFAPPPAPPPPAASIPPPASVPAPAPIPAPAAGAPPAQERLEAAIGPKAAWYLAQWQAMDIKRTQFTWNWAACLTNLLWFAYRKMWMPTAVFFLVVVALAVLGMLSRPLMIAGGVLTILAITATGALGTSFYRQHVARLVAQTGGMEREQALARLHAKGGVSPPAVILLAVLAIAASAGASFLVRQAQQPKTPTELPSGLSPRVGDVNDTPPATTPGTTPGATPGLAPGTVPGIGPDGEVDEEALRNALNEARNLLEQQGQGRDPLGEALSVPTN